MKTTLFCSLILVLLLAAACSGPSQTASPQGRSAASIQASPNPVPAGTDLGTATITWTTGDGSQGQVFVSEDGGADKLFAEGTNGSRDAPWIRSGSTYEFRLYAGSDHKTMLASVNVTRAT